MIKTLAFVVGGAAILGLSTYIIWKWLQNNQPDTTGDDVTPIKPIRKFLIETLEKLSYEHIVKCVEQVLQNEDIKEGAQLIVMPNKMAQDYYNYAKSQGQPFVTEGELTDDDRLKMVMVFITASDNMKDIVWGKVFVPNALADDFEDFIPCDKIYMRPINVK